MDERVNELRLILRRWDKETGLVEKTKVYPSLDALYRACIAVDDPDLIDRLVIRGQDRSGRTRTLTFVFQSVTVDSPS